MSDFNLNSILSALTGSGIGDMLLGTQNFTDPYTAQIKQREADRYRQYVSYVAQLDPTNNRIAETAYRMMNPGRSFSEASTANQNTFSAVAVGLQQSGIMGGNFRNANLNNFGTLADSIGMSGITIGNSNGGVYGHAIGNGDATYGATAEYLRAINDSYTDNKGNVKQNVGKGLSAADLTDIGVQLLRRRGAKVGDMEAYDMGTTATEYRENLDRMVEEGTLDKSSQRYSAMSKTADALKRREEILARAKEKNGGEELTAQQEQRALAGGDTDIIEDELQKDEKRLTEEQKKFKEKHGRDGSVNEIAKDIADREALTSAEIAATEKITSSGGVEMIASGSFKKETEKAIKDVTDNIAALKSVFKTEDMNELNNAAKALGLDIYGSKKAINETKEYISKAKSFALETGRSVEDVMGETAKIRQMGEIMGVDVTAQEGLDIAKNIRKNAAARERGLSSKTDEEVAAESMASSANARVQFQGYAVYQQALDDGLLHDSDKEKAQQYLDVINDPNSSRDDVKYASQMLERVAKGSAGSVIDENYIKKSVRNHANDLDKINRSERQWREHIDRFSENSWNDYSEEVQADLASAGITSAEDLAAQRKAYVSVVGSDRIAQQAHRDAMVKISKEKDAEKRKEMIEQYAKTTKESFMSRGASEEEATAYMESLKGTMDLAAAGNTYAVNAVTSQTNEFIGTNKKATTLRDSNIGIGSIAERTAANKAAMNEIDSAKYMVKDTGLLDVSLVVGNAADDATIAAYTASQVMAGFSKDARARGVGAAEINNKYRDVVRVEAADNLEAAQQKEEEAKKALETATGNEVGKEAVEKQKALDSLMDTEAGKRLTSAEKAVEDAEASGDTARIRDTKKKLSDIKNSTDGKRIQEARDARDAAAETPEGKEAIEAQKAVTAAEDERAAAERKVKESEVIALELDKHGNMTSKSVEALKSDKAMLRRMGMLGDDGELDEAKWEAFEEKRKSMADIKAIRSVIGDDTTVSKTKDSKGDKDMLILGDKESSGAKVANIQKFAETLGLSPEQFGELVKRDEKGNLIMAHTQDENGEWVEGADADKVTITQEELATEEGQRKALDEMYSEALNMAHEHGSTAALDTFNKQAKEAGGGSLMHEKATKELKSRGISLHEELDQKEESGRWNITNDGGEQEVAEDFMGTDFARTLQDDKATAADIAAAGKEAVASIYGSDAAKMDTGKLMEVIEDLRSGDDAKVAGAMKTLQDNKVINEKGEMLAGAHKGDNVKGLMADDGAELILDSLGVMKSAEDLTTLEEKAETRANKQHDLMAQMAYNIYQIKKEYCDS